MRPDFLIIFFAVAVATVRGSEFRLQPSADGSHKVDCADECASRLQAIESFSGLSWGQLEREVTQNVETEKSFEKLCNSFVSVDACLNECEHKQKNEKAGKIRSSYAGLRLICVTDREEFFAVLPCLARHEAIALDQCKRQINASLLASTQLATAVANKESHNFRMAFEQLCSNLGQMVECLVPITKEGCGESASFMLLRFITVGFGSVEQIYSQLQMSDQLPQHCRTLLHSPANGGHYHAARTNSAREGTAAALSILAIILMTG